MLRSYSGIDYSEDSDPTSEPDTEQMDTVKLNFSTKAYGL